MSFKQKILSDESMMKQCNPDEFDLKARALVSVIKLKLSCHDSVIYYYLNQELSPVNQSDADEAVL